ncbi:MAG: ATP-binding protein, partial [Myxococcota bacterium]
SINAVASVVFYFLMGLIGLIALALQMQTDGSSVLPQLIQTIAPSGARGLLVAGLLAIVMSTADSLLHIASSSLSHDVLKPFFQNISERNELFFCRIFCVFIGILSSGFAICFDDLLDMLVVFNEFWEPVVAVPLSVAIFGYCASARTFFITAAVSLLFTGSWELGFLPTGDVDGYLPGLLVSFITFFVARQFDPHAVRQGKQLKPGDEVEAPPIATLGQITETEEAVKRTVLLCFVLINYQLPSLLPGWPVSVNGYEDLLLRVTACLLCYGLLLQERMPLWWMQHVALWHWRLAVTFCLGFVPAFLLVSTQGASLWQINIVAGVCLCLLLLPWRTAVLWWAGSALLAPILQVLVYGDLPLLVCWQELSWGFWLLLLALPAWGTVMMHLYVHQHEQQIESMHLTHKTTIHEAGTPLGAANGDTVFVQNHLNTLLKVYDKAVKAGLSLEKTEILDDFTLKELVEAPKDVITSLSRIDGMLCMALNNARGQMTVINLERCSMRQCIQEALQQFPFNSREERRWVHVRGEDCQVYVDRQAMVMVLLNLLKNAFYFIRELRKGEIFIELAKEEGFHVLRFRDTAKGMSLAEAGRVFRKFYSKRQGGTGLGLFFCYQTIVRDFQGRISVRCEEDQFTEFIIRLPLL